MKVLGIIPARIGSTRVKQKALYRFENIPMVEHVYRRAKLCDKLDDLIVATDDKRIHDAIKSIDGNVMMTRSDHLTGLERMSEVVEAHGGFDYYVQINGDEILLNPESISASIDTLLKNPWADASILAVNFARENSPGDFKVVFKENMELMYVSRADIPANLKTGKKRTFLKAYHLMTFKKQTVIDFKNIGMTYLESIEDHEHLRLLEKGYKIVGKIVEDDCISLDAAADIDYIASKIKDDPTFLRIKAEMK